VWFGVTNRSQSPTGPLLGDHLGKWDIQGSGVSPDTVTLNTQASGSSMVVCTLGDPGVNTVPTDNKGNTYTSLLSNGYFGGAFAPFNMIVYAKTNAAGGSSHIVSMSKPSNTVQESTLIGVETKNSLTIQSSSIVARATGGAGVAYTSASVTTTAPALLLTFWGGDGAQTLTDQSAAPASGWTMTDSLFLGLTSYIQAAAAYKLVTAAGTYTVDWTPTQSQGAIIALIALQA